MLHEPRGLSRATDSLLSGRYTYSRCLRLQSAACLFFGSIQRTYRTISVGSVNAGHAAHLSSVSLPYKMTPMCCDLSLSTVGSGSTKPSLRRSFSTSPGFPVRNSQPGLTPLLLAYSWSTLGVSSSGLRVIEYTKISRPTGSPKPKRPKPHLQARFFFSWLKSPFERLGLCSRLEIHGHAILSVPFIASGLSWTLGKGSRPENARRWPIVTVSIDQVPSEHHG